MLSYLIRTNFRGYFDSFGAHFCYLKLDFLGARKLVRISYLKLFQVFNCITS